MVDATHLIVNSETPGHHHRPFHYSKRHTQWPERQHMRNATRATSRGCRARVVTKPDRQRNVLRDYFETRATRSTTPTEGTAGACPHVRGSWTRHVPARTKPLPPRAHHRRRPRPTRLRRPRVGRWVHERARGRTWRARLGQRRAAGTWQAHL